MPCKFETNKIKLPREYDRRCKYSDAQKQEVKDMYKAGMAQRAIARKTGISRRMVSFILFPERLKLCNQQYKERRKDGRYYNKDAWRETMREHRQYKRKILTKIKLC